MAANFLILEPGRVQVAIAGRVTDAQTGQALSGVQIAITAAPAAFTSWLALHAKQYEARWERMVERADRTRTTKDGHYHFLDLPAGQYTLTASFPGVGSRYGSAEVKAKIVVTRGRNDPGKISLVTTDIALPPTTLKGRVTTADTQPVFLANVVVQGSGEHTFSDDEGNYRLVGLEVGTRDVQISARGYNVRKQVTFTKPGEQQHLDVALEK